MKAVIQRVTSASVAIEGRIVEEIGAGLCVLLGISRDDSPSDVRYIVDKILNIRLFEDGESGKRWNKSVTQQKLEVLCISQVTLYHKLKGNKPDFHTAMAPDLSSKMFQEVVDMLKETYDKDLVKCGVFGAYCNIAINNDGPVTIVIESPLPAAQNKT